MNKNKNAKIIPFKNNLTIESFCSPFKIKNTFNEFNFYFSGWMTNTPFNENHFDSYLSFLNSDTYIFISNNEMDVINLIQSTLVEHYDCNTEISNQSNDDTYSLIQLKKID